MFCLQFPGHTRSPSSSLLDFFLFLLLTSLPLTQPGPAGHTSKSYFITSSSSSSSSSYSTSSSSSYSSSSTSSLPPTSSPHSSSSDFSSSFSPSSSSSPQEDILHIEPQDPVMACYYGSWAVYRPGRGKFDVEDIDPFLCTHVLYAFAGLQASTGTIVSLDPYNDLYDNYGKGGYIRFTSLKKINPKLKTLLSIGGWNEGSTKYSEMALSASSRATFIASCVKFLLKFGFDGLDLDWEYPTQRGGRPEDKVNFALLLEEMRSKFKQYNLLLTSAVSAGKNTIDAAYNVTALARNLDYVFLMAYDFHGSWEPYAHHHSPLYAYSGDKGANKLLNTDFAVRYWLQAGLPSGRLVMGVGLYGRCFTLTQADRHDVYAPAPQPGLPGPYTRSPGFLGYNEVCEEQQQVRWSVVRDKNMVSPYAFYERQWCGYDDVTSAAAKTDYIKSLGLAGAMVWSIETDDFHGVCQTERKEEEEAEGEEGQHPQTFPLITTIRTILRDGRPIPTPTPAPISPPTTETTTTTTTTPPGPPPPPPPPPSAICHREGLNRYPAGDCTIFYICHQVDQRWLAWLFHCPPGTRFVEDMQVCDYPEGHQACSLLPPVTDPPTTTTTTTTSPNTTTPSIPTTITSPDTRPPTATPTYNIHNTAPTVTATTTTNSATSVNPTTTTTTTTPKNIRFDRPLANSINYSPNLVKLGKRFNDG